MNTDEIVLRVWYANNTCMPADGMNKLKEFAHALLAELSKDVEPIYQFRPDCENWIDCTKVFYDGWGGEKRTLLTQPLPTADIEQRTAEACINACRDSYANGDMLLDAINDLLQGKWREYL